MADDMINPKHYKLELPDGREIEAIDYIVAVLGPRGAADYCRGSALKYLSRAGRKNANLEAEDFRKAAWFCEKAAQLVEDDFDSMLDDFIRELDERPYAESHEK